MGRRTGHVKHPPVRPETLTQSSAQAVVTAAILARLALRVPSRPQHRIESSRCFVACGDHAEGGSEMHSRNITKIGDIVWVHVVITVTLMIVINCSVSTCMFSLMPLPSAATIAQQ